MITQSLASIDDIAPPKVLKWRALDPENRFGFQAGKFTRCNLLFTFLIGLAGTAAFFAAMIYLVQPREDLQRFAAMFLERGPTQYVAVFLFSWASAILFVKRLKVGLQSRALEIEAVPSDPAFVLTPDTSEQVLQRIRESVDDPHQFVLLNRIERALSNLRNLGNAADVSTILKHQSENDEEHSAASYSLVNGFIWAVPVLGFIGTVLGLSRAMAGFGDTLQAASDIAALKTSLTGVTGGLATAFETTLVALVAALLLQLAVSFLQNRENAFLDDCNDFCHSQIASRLRLNR